jgi:type I restriction enzyme, R subunit
LHRLAEKGFGKAQMVEMQKIIDAEKSDFFYVLAFVAFATPAMTRADRAVTAKAAIHRTYSSKQEIFLDFVLSHYVQQGVEELDQLNLTPLLKLKYQAIADAMNDLGGAGRARLLFNNFQKFLYQRIA